MARAPPAVPQEKGARLARLQEVNAELLQLGASEAYCEEYFALGKGECKEKFGGICMCHDPGSPPLPSGLICDQKFKTRFNFLTRRMEFVEEERKNLKQQWTDLKTAQLPAEKMLANNQEGEDMARQRKNFLSSQIMHKLGELRGLQDEMYKHLTGNVRRVNAKEFHERVTELLLEKMDILGQLAVGRRVRAKKVEPALPSEST